MFDEMLVDREDDQRQRGSAVSQAVDVIKGTCTLYSSSCLLTRV